MTKREFTTLAAVYSLAIALVPFCLVRGPETERRVMAFGVPIAMLAASPLEASGNGLPTWFGAAAVETESASRPVVDVRTGRGAGTASEFGSARGALSSARPTVRPRSGRLAQAARVPPRKLRHGSFAGNNPPHRTDWSGARKRAVD